MTGLRLGFVLKSAQRIPGSCIHYHIRPELQRLQLGRLLG